MDELIDFYKDVNRIKHLEREGWKQIGVEGTIDTIASPSLGASLIGWWIAEKNGLDSNKVTKMMNIHDLVMAHMKDITPEDEEYDSKKQIERIKKHEMYKNVPREIKKEFKELFEEYQARETKEAKIAVESNKIDTLLQALIYSEELGENKVKEFMECYEEEIRSKTGKEILNSIKNKIN